MTYYQETSGWLFFVVVVGFYFFNLGFFVRKYSFFCLRAAKINVVLIGTYISL